MARHYILIAGERRLEAARLAKLEFIPAILRQVSDQDRLELALIENVQRADLMPLETAEAYRQLHEEFKSITRRDLNPGWKKPGECQQYPAFVETT